MKKTLCLILTSIFILSSASSIFNVIASGAVTEPTPEEFANKISALIDSSETASLLPGEKPFECNNCDHRGFENSRLIVKSKYKIDSLDATNTVKGTDNIWILQFSSPHSAHEAYNYYLNKTSVDFVEPDRNVTLYSSNSNYISPLSEDEEEYLSWGPEYIGFDKLNESLLTKPSSLEEVVVAVVDSGVDPDHPLLKGRVVPTKINTSSSGKRNDSTDDLGHGTQVAGIIADSTINKIIIKPYKVIDFRGHGTVITVAAGINCAISDNVDVINVSIGFEEDSEVLKAAIDNAETKGITVVGAAGNDGTENIYYPASYNNVIKVTAVNNMGVLANFSTYGNDVNFAAPGVNIKTSTLNGKYTEVSGTSFAAPFVTAACASVLLANTKASPEDVNEILKSYAFLPAEYQAENKYGQGILKVPIYSESFNSTDKTATPYFSVKNGFYIDKISLEIYCDTPDSIIYYTTDKSMPTKTNPNAVIYDGKPLELSQTAIINAVAYSDGKFRSQVGTFTAIIAPYADQSEFIIDSSGTILSYTGKAKSFTVPKTINGIEVTTIGIQVFKNSEVTEVILPDTVKTIGPSAFENCKNLRTIYAMNVESIGNRAFYNCESLRNPFFANIKKIGSYSFYNTGSKENLIYGRTFRLYLKNLTEIPEGAFMYSAISGVNLGKISSIGKNAFSECNSLTNIYAEYISYLPDGAFKGLNSLISVHIDDLSYIPSSAFSTCENLLVVAVPKAELINSSAFENCSSLMSVNLPAAEIIYANAFNGCTSLTELNLPSMTGFNESVYTAQNPNIMLPPNLETFRAEKMQRTVRDMFSQCKNIKNIFLNNVTDIKEFTFRGCHNIFFLNIENVKHLKENSLSYCTIEFIDARSLETTADLPDNSGILLSNNFYESTDIGQNLTVYGTPGTFIERYSNKKGYNFIGIPLIYNELPEYVTENSETVYINAIGFNLEYQWFSNTVKSTTGGTPIDGATSPDYTFTDADTAPYYFCKITQTDIEKETVIYSEIITKDTTPADYTEYEKAVAEAKAINRSFYENIYILDEALAVNVYNRFSCEQDIVDAQTKAIRDAIDSLITKGVKNIKLRSSKTELNIFEKVKIMPEINPIDSIYDKIEWYTDNDNVLLVTKNGQVMCIGDGTANVYTKVTNPDGTTVTGVITIYCELEPLGKIAGFLFGSFIKLLFIIYNK